jgi:hypothetical protein
MYCVRQSTASVYKYPPVYPISSYMQRQCSPETNSPFFCPIAHELQLGHTLSIKDEKSLYAPRSLASYLLKVKCASPMTRQRVEFGDILLHQPGQMLGRPLGAFVEHCLRENDAAKAADALVAACMPVDMPISIQTNLLPYRGSNDLATGRPTRIRMSILAWAVICKHFDMADKLVVRYNANVNSSWGRHAHSNASDAPWGRDIAALMANSVTRDLLGNTLEIDDPFSHLSCLTLALDESFNHVDADVVRWLMDHSATFSYMHMQQVVTLTDAHQASQMQAVSLAYPAVSCNYLGGAAGDSTFDNLIYRVLEVNHDALDMQCVLAMAFRILDHPSVRERPLANLSACGINILRQFHWLKCNPFRTLEWLPVMLRLIEMGAVVDSSMFEYVVGALPGDRGYPLQHRVFDCSQWVNTRTRWPDDVLFALCHSVKPASITSAISLLPRAVLYSRGANVISALMSSGASVDSEYKGMTGLQWAQAMRQSDVASQIRITSRISVSAVSSGVSGAQQDDLIDVDVDTIFEGGDYHLLDQETGLRLSSIFEGGDYHLLDQETGNRLFSAQ